MIEDVLGELRERPLEVAGSPVLESPLGGGAILRKRHGWAKCHAAVQ